MARWMITISGKGIRKASIDKLLDKLKGDFDGASLSVTEAAIPESRAERFADAQSKVSDAKAEMESLRDELQEWYDGMPENLQGGSKGETLQESISNLEEIVDKCDEIEGASVEFPGMMG